MRQFHWTQDSLATSYMAITAACLVVLGATYLVGLRRAVLKRTR
jgi:hypothetical protein